MDVFWGQYFEIYFVKIEKQGSGTSFFLGGIDQVWGFLVSKEARFRKVWLLYGQRDSQKKKKK